MDKELIVEALEHYYNDCVYMNYDRNKEGIEGSFENLRKSIQTQQQLVSLKKELGLSVAKHEEELESLYSLWDRDVADPHQLISDLVEELELQIKMYQEDLNRKEYQHDTKFITVMKKYKLECEEKLKQVQEYSISDIEKITGPKPF